MRNRNSVRNHIICPSCGHRNRASARLCTGCYASLASTESRDLPTLRRPTGSTRHTATSRADEIRAKVRGIGHTSDEPLSPSQGSQPWWQDWKMGALVAGFLGVLGLRKTELGKDIRNLDGSDILDKLL